MFRFRLRTFLIVFTLFCLLLGWRVSAVESVERPIRELERLGWKIVYESEMPGTSSSGEPMLVGVPRRSYWQIILLGFRPCDLPEFAWLGHQSQMAPRQETGQVVQRSANWINRLPSIDALDLSENHLGTDDLLPIIACQHLNYLRLTSTALDDSSVDQLAKLTQLEELTLWDTNLTAEGVAELERRLPNCRIEHDFNDD